MDNTHNEFVAARTTATDHGGDGRRWHAAGADGDDARTDDATVITGTASAEPTETNAAQSIGGR